MLHKVQRTGSNCSRTAGMAGGCAALQNTCSECSQPLRCSTAQSAELFFGSSSSASYSQFLFPILSLGYLVATTINSVPAVRWTCACLQDRLARQ